MSITIREIAAQAGVTKSTVSKVLNDRPGVGEETRKKIREIVKQTGFRPSSAARALAHGRTENIGLLIPRDAGLALNGSYWSALTTSITLEAARRGYSVLLLTPGSEGNEETLVQEVMSNRKAEGLIIGHPLLTAGSLSLLTERGFPFVTVGRVPGWESRAIDVDNAGGARDMTNYILEKGFRKIAMITGPESLLHMRERVRGFREAMAGQDIPPFGVVHSEFDQDSVEQAIGRLMAESDPEALFIGSGGEFLLRVLRAMEGRGMNRHNLGLAVFDDYPYLEFTDPGITAVRQPTEELGSQAVTMLDSRITGKPDRDGPCILKTTIIPRCSCRE